MTHYFIMGIMLASLISCQRHSERSSAEAKNVSEESIYQIQSGWTDQTGATLPLKALSGKIQIFTMVYTSCQYACPRILSDLHKIESALSESARRKTGFVLVSFDPERDTPLQLAQFAKQHRLPSSQWRLLTGREEDVRELAALLGVNYKKMENGDFSHSNVIVVLNAAGEIVHRQEGLGGTEETVTVIQRLTD